MCGIVGFIGENALMNVFDGLRTLEYRGYDSAGVAYFVDDKIKIVKESGRLQNVIDIVSMQDQTWSNLAIGHTRWATHGAPTQLNAHPHSSYDITIVHNGIIENYLDLKTIVENSGKKVVSETDTEILAHLISISVGNTLLDKVKNAVRQVHGSYAILVVDSNDPKQIIAARKASPLVIGKCHKSWIGHIVSSDIQGIVAHTDSAYIIEDNEFVVITEESFSIYDQNNNVIDRSPIKINWTSDSISIGNYETYMLKEIFEQPASILNTILKNNWQNISEYLNKSNYDNIVFVACGSSYHAALVGVSLFEGLGGIRSRAKLASEIKYDGTIIDNKTLVVAISQSGETADTLSAVKYCKSKGAKILSIINVMGSSLSRESDFLIYTAAGPEISVASTKAFIAQLTVLYMVAGILRAIKEFDDIYFERTKNEMQEVVKNIENIFNQMDKMEKISEDFTNNSVLFLGRGLNSTIAMEGALKLKEISYLHAEGFAAGEIKHGPIAIIDNNTKVIAIAIDDLTYDKIVSNIREVQARGANVIAIISEGSKFNLTDKVLYVPRIDTIFTPILVTIALQLLAYYIAKKLGRNIDKPRNLAKSVTVE